MIIEDVHWIRQYRHKLCPNLRSQIMNWYRPFRFTPCFLTKRIRNLKKLNKIPIVVETQNVDDMICSMENIALACGCQFNNDLYLVDCFSTTVNEKSLKKLVQDPRVKKIWYDSQIKAFLDISGATVNYSILWNKNLTGENIVVAVLDTGIANHPDLKGRIIAFEDFIKKRVRPYDDNGHGTHVAGALASNGYSSNGKYTGAAPKSKIIGLKVLNKVGSGKLSNLIAAIQWCIKNQKTYNIRIINLSLGLESNSTYKDDLLCTAVGKAWDAGIIVCAAAGNSGPNNRSVNSPAIHPKIISVGALDDRSINSNDYNIASFSSRGPTIDGYTKPDVVAPGVDIISLSSLRSAWDKENKNRKTTEHYISMSGTSMACPMCAGVIAQILQANPILTPNQVKNLLLKSSRPLKNVDANAQGAGMIDALNLFNITNNPITKR